MTELGKRLKEAREAKNISLDELQEMTKIQKRYLIGIEEGNYNIMPGNFYVRAFIKQYAEAVGLDSEQLFEEYKHEIPSSQHEELPEQLSRVKSRQQLSPKTSKIIDMLPKLLMTVLIIGAAVALWLIIQKWDVNNKTSKENVTNNPAEVEQSKNSPLEEAKDKEKSEESKGQKEVQSSEQPSEEEENMHTLTVIEQNGKESTVELTNTNQFILEVASKGTSWVEVHNGKGHTFFAATLNENETQRFDLSNESEILVKIGKATDIEMKINGQPFTYPISPSEEVFQKIKILFKKS
ncbi:cytoskeletal protein RodZ [Anoxybacillus vitaminiphilus]|uniref:Cytoskeletal protein RodZ n=1 Tax=Paranoxybacillus vitaminiphilus TaxID=581036 RepID=A0A327YSA5_9BACL|nr:RodZ domain-containing protein [Anoxybacillus vitaminiphilus]RAK23441.1 cytoskeletal protein RodZ [Anoxybacillus vitaminiphilus]